MGLSGCKNPYALMGFEEIGAGANLERLPI